MLAGVQKANDDFNLLFKMVKGTIRDNGANAEDGSAEEYTGAAPDYSMVVRATSLAQLEIPEVPPVQRATSANGTFSTNVSYPSLSFLQERRAHSVLTRIYLEILP